MADANLRRRVGGARFVIRRVGHEARQIDAAVAVDDHVDIRSGELHFAQHGCAMPQRGQLQIHIEQAERCDRRVIGLAQREVFDTGIEEERIEADLADLHVAVQLLGDEIFDLMACNARNQQETAECVERDQGGDHTDCGHMRAQPGGQGFPALPVHEVGTVRRGRIVPALPACVQQNPHVTPQ